MTINSNSFPKELWPGLKGKFDGMYADLQPTWKKIYRVLPSEKKYEEMISEYNFGLIDVKPEGQAMNFDDQSQGLTIRHTHKTYGKGAIITEEALEDNLYESTSNRAVEGLMKSHATTEEYTHADIFNKGFTVAQNHQEGGDGQYLFDTDHTAKNGTYSNLLTAAGLSRTSLEDGLIQIQLTKDETGVHPAGLMGQMLVVPANLQFTAAEILKSDLQPDTANNAINTMTSIMPYVSWQFLDATYGGSNTAWFIKTNADYGLIHYQRRTPTIRFANDDETMTQKIMSSSRYVTGVVDCRGIYGNAGA